jgi:O-methyltransferase
MVGTLKRHYENWWANPRRMKISYILERFTAIASVRFRREAPSRLLDPPIDPGYVAVLCEKAFCRSVACAKDFSELDEGRLANLWNMAGLVGSGIFLEIGTFRGGTALHICNAIDFYQLETRFYCFDPFETGGFEDIGETDKGLKITDFTGVNRQDVERLLSSKHYARIVQGYFPAVAEKLELREIAYCHLDVDTYEATYKCLEYLAPRLARKSLIVLDDVGHVGIYGVDRALREFVEAHPEFLWVPLFPCQAVLLPKNLW